MKVSFMFVAAAGFACAVVVPVQAQIPPQAAPVTSTVSGGGCAGCSSGGCSSCAQDSCCTESWGHRFKARLGGLFNRNSCDSCGGNTWGHHQAGSGSCCQAAPTTCCAPAPTTCCAPVAQSCDTCGNQGGHKLFGRLKGMFNRGGSGGCDTCNTCNSCGSTGAITGGPISYGTVPPKMGEPLPPPKDMPNKMPAGKEPPIKGAAIEIPGQISPAQIAPPTVPALQPAPAINPANPADLNNKENRPF